MSSPYNHKINSDGTYKNFYGWSIISIALSDMKCIENFLNNSHILNTFYSALPSSSYHTTVYNLWCNGQPLLNHQKRVINRNYSDEILEFLLEDSKKIGEFRFNPSNCIEELLYKLSFSCNKASQDKKITLTVKNVYFGETLGIEFESCEALEFLNDKRRDFIKNFHMTLAYKYKSFSCNDFVFIKNEVELLNRILKNQTIVFDVPNVYLFNNMTVFTRFDD